jgi:hypothetical protein
MEATLQRTLREISKRLGEGRGQGVGADYIPWLKVQDFPSRGRVHRMKGWKHSRVHHLFSDLERNVFLYYLWPFSIIDIREQFPLLPIEETIEIAKEIGVRHPTNPRTKSPVVMTTDSLLTCQQGLKATYHPRTVKYLKDLQKMRAREKLEIERRYWLAPPRNLCLKIITEQQISIEFVQNMLWIHPYYWLADLYPLTLKDVNRVASVLQHLVLNEDRPLGNIAQTCDRLLRNEGGTSLEAVS